MSIKVYRRKKIVAKAFSLGKDSDENDITSESTTIMSVMSFNETKVYMKKKVSRNSKERYINIENVIQYEKGMHTILKKTLFNEDEQEIKQSCKRFVSMISKGKMKRMLTMIFNDEISKEIIKTYLQLLHKTMLIVIMNISKEKKIIVSLLYLLHSNILLIIDFILSKIPFDFTNTYIIRLKNILQERTSLQKIISSYHISQIKCNNQSALNLLHQITNNNLKNKSLYALSHRDKATLVLDLDETLIHCNISSDTKIGKVMIRPYMEDFLHRIKRFYNLILFTAGTKDYAEPIIKVLEEKEKMFSCKLYRDSTKMLNGETVKDLSILNIDMKKIIIVDNIESNYQLQKDNGILIKSFYGEDECDTSLYELMNILIQFSFEEENDLRLLIRKYKKLIKNKVTCVNCNRESDNK